MYINRRYLDIILYLYKAAGFVSSSELSAILEISTKTIAREMKKYEHAEEIFQNFGFHIIVKQGYGYRLDIHDIDKFQHLIQDCKNGELIIESAQDKEYDIIRLLLQKNNYCTIADIADELFVSSTTVSNSLRRIRSILEPYGVRLDNKVSTGIRLVGSEMNLRLCMSRFFLFSDQNQYELEINKNAITKLTAEILKKYHVYISDIGRDHLVAHILISIDRAHHNYSIQLDEKERDRLAAKKEFMIAKELIEELKKVVCIQHEEEETLYLTIQLLSKQSLDEETDKALLSEDIEATLRKIFIEIHHKLGIDLNEDQEVFNYLVMHFEPMFVRLKYGVKSTNPLLNEVKTRQTTSFEMGIIAKEVIQKDFDYTLDDDEISYLAMYFSLALDRLYTIHSPKNVLVVCGLGVCSARMLVYKLKHQYKSYIKETVTCQYHEIEDIDLSAFDCIISTVEKPIYAKIPVMYLTDFLSDLQDDELETFLMKTKKEKFNLLNYLKEDYFYITDTMQNEEQAISFIINQMREHTEIPKELKEHILQREQLSSTAYGNYCALPHPIKMCTDENLFSILILRKGMIWGGKKVKCVFLLSPSKYCPSDLRNFNDALAAFILDTEAFSKFMQSPNFSNLKNLLSAK